ncbi:MAG: hypothetical protein CL879_07890 [Dehalococcoidia bacterium]|nr:hypothetical protein [Dehalococcoidia bacterium]|tara:strand:- start:314 stop:1297 length:984 start_codon:yes stop_codon:yes gene_type:complete
MALIATEEQKRELNDNGFTVIENLLTEAEVATLDDAIEEVSLRRDQAADLPALSRPGSTGTGFLAMRNGILQHPALLDLVDRPDILSYVVDMVGWNIQNRDSVLLRTPPEPEAVDHGRMGLGWHFDYEEEFGGITRGDPMPLIDFKVGWYISDSTEPGHATIIFVPGSHNWTYQQRATWSQDLDPSDIFELRVPAGSAMLWRGTLLHGVTPNLSKTVRKAVYVSYAPRWLRPTGHIFQDEDLVERSDPVRRQLLGAMGDLSDPLGNSPDVSPDSQYWFTHDWNSVPLKEWAESCAGDPPYDWGTGYGVSETKFLPGFEFPNAIDPRK